MLYANICGLVVSEFGVDGVHGTLEIFFVDVDYDVELARLSKLTPIMLLSWHFDGNYDVELARLGKLTAIMIVKRLGIEMLTPR